VESCYWRRSNTYSKVWTLGCGLWELYVCVWWLGW